MNIRAKLSLTFVLLMIFGVTAISSYAILFIRNYLLDSGVETMERHARWMALSVRELPDDSFFELIVSEMAKASGYDVGLYDADSTLYVAFGSGRPADDDRVKVFANIYGSRNAAIRLELSLPRETLFEPVKTIRWIIYTGMFISIGIILLVSNRVASSLARPIRALNDAALRIANGDVTHQVELARTDEFGTLATSINRMSERLRADLNELEAAAERQSRFYADIAHEIRNPLHTLMASLDMARLEQIPVEKRVQYVDNARHQTDRLSRLFNDLLTLQRFDADAHPVHIQAVELNPVLEKLRDVYAGLAEQKGLRLDIPSTDAFVMADAGKLEQVLDNLISNAVKYVNQGRVWVDISPTSGGVELSVGDTGPGIAPEHLPNLFDRFYRTDKARSRDSGGTGLGLAIVKSILDAHAVDIRVQSDLGIGTRFSFTLTNPTP
jgi:signal transduction histidine kinase